MRKGFLKKLIMVVSVVLVAISIVGFVASLTKSSSSSKGTAKCNHRSLISMSVIEPATCTEEGKKRAYCKDCGDWIYDSIPASHSFETIEGTPATCTTDGLTDSVQCTACDEVVTESTVIPATGHIGTEGENCQTCGELITVKLVAVSNGEKVAGNTYRFVFENEGQDMAGFMLCGESNLNFEFTSNGSVYVASGLSSVAPFKIVVGDGTYIDITFELGQVVSHEEYAFDDSGQISGTETLYFTITEDTTLSMSGCFVYRIE